MEKKRILVVDDSEIVLTMAREALEDGGYVVQTALSAPEADILLSAGQLPDLIILDVMMPIIDGDKKARQLKAQEATRNIPILLISTKPEEDLRFLVRESGADGYVRKPFADERLLESVAEVLGRTV